MKIETEEQVKEIYEYCKSRLPKINDYQLEVVQGHEQFTNEKSGKVIVMDGVILNVYKGETKIASSFGVDANDALLDIYKQLFIFFTAPVGKVIVEKPALGKTHLSYRGN